MFGRLIIFRSDERGCQVEPHGRGFGIELDRAPQCGDSLAQTAGQTISVPEIVPALTIVWLTLDDLLVRGDRDVKVAGYLGEEGPELEKLSGLICGNRFVREHI